MSFQQRDKCVSIREFHNLSEFNYKARIIKREPRHRGSCSVKAISQETEGLAFSARHSQQPFLFSKASIPAVRPIGTLIKLLPSVLSLGVQRPGHETDH
jgi:ribosome assembly protein YihI (activator of Der GTPase)